MNFADAIRQAAKNAGERAPHVEYSPPDFEAAQTETTEMTHNTDPTTPEVTATAAVPADVTGDDLTDTIEATTWVDPTSTPVTVMAEVDEEDSSAAGFAFDAVTTEPISMPEAPAGSVRGGNVVRLELFLSPEQLSSLFRALVATQHGMMTLREAANYLRVHPGTVEQMATDGTIPGLMIEGRWRFPKSSLDEWLNVQVFKAKGESDAA